jgi:hypothetical protein
MGGVEEAYAEMLRRVEASGIRHQASGKDGDMENQS